MRLLSLLKALKNRAGGEEEIRTLGTVTGTLAFQASPFDHSGTSPFFVRQTTNLRFFFGVSKKSCEKKFNTA